MKTTDKMVRIEEVIITSLTVRGNGSSTPFRHVLQVFSRQGELIAENDPLPTQIGSMLYNDEKKALTEYFFKNINAFQEDPFRLLSEWEKINKMTTSEGN